MICASTSLPLLPDGLPGAGLKPLRLPGQLGGQDLNLLDCLLTLPLFLRPVRETHVTLVAIGVSSVFPPRRRLLVDTDLPFSQPVSYSHL